VAHADGDDAAEKVQVLIAVGVPNVLVLGVGDDQRLLVVMKDARKQVLALSEKDLLFVIGGVMLDSNTARVSGARDTLYR
jgi:hypothetical protein